MQGRARSKLRVFEQFTFELGGLSTCKRLHVGCVIVTPTMSEVLAIGYNGPSAGEDNGACRNTPGQCGCIHAEANALVKCSTQKPGWMICSTCPCEHCAGLIVNSRKVSHIIFANQYRNDLGLNRLNRGGIIIRHTMDVTDETLREWWDASRDCR